MSTPKDNTEIVKMFRDVKNCLWNSVTPVKVVDRHFSEYASNFKYPSLAGSSSFNPTKVSTKLSFSELDESNVFYDSSALAVKETPESLKRKLLSTEVELQASYAKVKAKESFISLMEPENKKLCMSLENKLEESRKQNDLAEERITELESRLNWSKQQISSAKNQVNNSEQQRKKEIEFQKMTILTLQEECSNLKIEIANVKSEKSEDIRKLNNEVGRLELEISMLSEKSNNAQTYIKNLKRQITDMEEKVSRYNHIQNKLILAEENIKSLEAEIESNKESALIVASRQTDLKLFSELQKENNLLKEETSKYKENNIALFQEKLWSLQEKLTQAEKKNSIVAKLQVENEQLKAKLDQWEELLDEKSNFRSPMAFYRKLSEYQQNEALLTNKLSQFSLHNQTLEKQMNEKTDMIASLTQKLKKSQLSLSLQENSIKHMQKEIIILAKAEETIQKILDSYLNDSTMVGISTNAEQIRHLEESYSQYKKEFEKSGKEIEELNNKVRMLNSVTLSPAAGSELKRLKKENEDLLNKVTTLKNENYELKEDCAKQALIKKETGDNEKIVHLRFNPLDAANRRHLDAFEKLKEQNKELKRRICVLEEEGAQAVDVTMKVQQKLESEKADLTLQALKEQLSASERKQRFILENAKIKSMEFREAVYRLTGFRIDIPTAETYKLSHLYRESKEDYLLFKINSGGIQLVETEYSKQLQDRMQLYLHQYDSFPGFLSSLTLDLLKQKSFVMEQ